MRGVLLYWQRRDGGYISIADGDGSASTKVEGHFVFSKQQFRRLIQQNRGGLRLWENTDWLYDENAAYQDWPETSTTAPILIQNTWGSVRIHELIEQVMRINPGQLICTVPSQWVSCLLITSPTMGMIGWIEAVGAGQIAFFYSRAEGRRLIEMQQNVKAEARSGFLSSLKTASGLPRKSREPTVILGGTMANALCAAEALSKGFPGFSLMQLVQSQGDA